MSDLLTRLKVYRAQMAPHNTSRQGGKLLLESIDEIERLYKLLDQVGARNWGLHPEQKGSGQLVLPLLEIRMKIRIRDLILKIRRKCERRRQNE